LGNSTRLDLDQRLDLEHAVGGLVDELLHPVG
jgi:hypothetical protein